MKFENKLIKAQLVKRYKRFLADIILPDSSEVTAYCPNTGSMESCGQNGDIIYFDQEVSIHRRARTDGNDVLTVEQLEKRLLHRIEIHIDKENFLKVTKQI